MNFIHNIILFTALQSISHEALFIVIIANNECPAFMNIICCLETAKQNTSYN